MIDISTGKPFTRRSALKGLAAIIAAGVAPSVSASTGGLRRGLGARLGMMGENGTPVIRFDGHESVDFGFNNRFLSGESCEVKFTLGNISANSSIFGCSGWENNYLMVVYSSMKLGFSGSQAGPVIEIDSTHTAKLTDYVDSITIDGSSYYLKNVRLSASAGNQHLVIGSHGSTSSTFVGDVWWMKVRRSNSSVRMSIVPKIEDGIVGFYDEIGGVFYPQTYGTGSLQYVLV